MQSEAVKQKLLHVLGVVVEVELETGVGVGVAQTPQSTEHVEQSSPNDA